MAMKKWAKGTGKLLCQADSVARVILNAADAWCRGNVLRFAEALAAITVIKNPIFFVVVV
jgi:hypothetical protein